MLNLKKYNNYINESINIDNVNNLIDQVKNMVKTQTLETKKKINNVKIYYTVDGVKINTEDSYFLKAKLINQQYKNNKFSIFNIKIIDVSTGLTSLPYQVISVDGDTTKTYSNEEVVNVVDFNPKGGEVINKGTILGKYIVSKQENINLLYPKDDIKEEPKSEIEKNTIQINKNKPKSNVNDDDTIKKSTDKINELVKNTPKENLGDMRTNCMKSITVVDDEIKKLQKIENYSNIPLIVNKINILIRNKELLEDVLKNINTKINGK